MDCQTFRQTLERDSETGNSEGDSPMMATHFEECDACQLWLGKQVVMSSSVAAETAATSRATVR